eukprot:1568848-Prymnesium_polylepis.2
MPAEGARELADCSSADAVAPEQEGVEPRGAGALDGGGEGLSAAVGHLVPAQLDRAQRRQRAAAEEGRREARFAIGEAGAEEVE